MSIIDKILKKDTKTNESNEAQERLLKKRPEPGMYGCEVFVVPHEDIKDTMEEFIQANQVAPVTISQSNLPGGPKVRVILIYQVP